MVLWQKYPKRFYGTYIECKRLTKTLIKGRGTNVSIYPAMNACEQDGYHTPIFLIMYSQLTYRREYNVVFECVIDWVNTITNCRCLT